MRSRPGIQVSAGGGIVGTLRGDRLSPDSTTATRQSAWLTGQRTLGSRFDLLAIPVVDADGRAPDGSPAAGLLARRARG